ncbi:hypothetical protein PVK06_015919 [Gossypium arboreum]|uniref:RNase H type-1 domain-containing protein n=1 Tax=Gossypium arboreum TaxID=29729 RepID=A0ABR0PYJ8_GOSAR|nr:hypothetical protein PVK06_015919 [Gossypium arboreum]
MNDVVENEIGTRWYSYCAEIEALTEGGEGAFKDIYVCRFNWIVRSGNKAAHAMAQDGLKRREECFWMEEAPLLVVAVVDEDRRLLD